MKASTQQILPPLPVLSLAEAVNHPAYREQRGMIEFLIQNKGKNLFPKKDLAEQKRLGLAKMHLLTAQNSGVLLKDALSVILKNLPAGFPPEELQPLTKYLIQAWFKMRQNELGAV